MKIETPEQYIEQLTDERRVAVEQLRKVILDNLPEGFSETLSYEMLAFVVPHSLYPNGYHCNPKQPLPFISLASQKNYIALYHMGLYADNNLLKGLLRSIQNTSKLNWIWEKAVSDLKNLSKFHLS